MQMKARMALQPRLNAGMLVCPIVVHDQMKVQGLGRLDINAFQKANKFLMPMPGHAVADDFAVEHAEGGKKSGRAVTLVVVRLASRQAGAQGQQWPCPVQRLNLAFLVNA